VFSRAYRHFGGEKIGKKTLSKNSMVLHGFTQRSSEKLLQNSGFSIGRTPFFFHQKCFLEHTGISEGKNIEKKTLS
jgi:hypothetical protein